MFSGDQSMTRPIWEERGSGFLAVTKARRDWKLEVSVDAHVVAVLSELDSIFIFSTTKGFSRQNRCFQTLLLTGFDKSLIHYLVPAGREEVWFPCIKCGRQ